MKNIVLILTAIALIASVVWAVKTDFKKEDAIIAVITSLVSLIGIFGYQNHAKSSKVTVTGTLHKVNVDVENEGKEQSPRNNDVSVAGELNDVNVNTKNK